MHTKEIVWSGVATTLACDGKCSKAWGVCARPRQQLGSDDDDFAHLADDELGDAPADPGEYEGGWGKPSSPEQMNKWCARQCERSVAVPKGQPVTLPDYSQRVLNQPWKHTGAVG